MAQSAILLVRSEPDACSGVFGHLLPGTFSLVAHTGLSADPDAVIFVDIGPPDTAMSANYVRWGLAAARALRLRSPPFLGPMILASFEREEDLANATGGAILEAPGVSFLRLPVTAQEIRSAIARAHPSSVAEVSHSIPRLRQEASAGFRERARKLSHRMNGILAAPLAVARGLARLQGARGVNGRALRASFAILTDSWPGLPQRVSAIAYEADVLLGEAANLGIARRTLAPDSTFQALANDALMAFRWIFECRSDAGIVEPALVPRIVAAGTESLERLEAMQTLLDRLSHDVGAEGSPGTG